MLLLLMLVGAFSLQISPSLGPAAGGTPVQVTGEDFLPQPTLACFIGQSPLTALFLMRAKTLSGVTSPGSGLLSVTCTNDGQTYPFPASSFLYPLTQVLLPTPSYESTPRHRQQTGLPHSEYTAAGALACAG